MSHFTEVKTRLTNESILKTALKSMGFSLVEDQQGVQVRGFFGDSVAADFKILTSTNYDIGFKKVDGSYELVGDWELLPKVSGIEQAHFTAALKKEYARVAILETAKAQGYGVECVENEETGTIEMVVTQW